MTEKVKPSIGMETDGSFWNDQNQYIIKKALLPLRYEGKKGFSNLCHNKNKPPAMQVCSQLALASSLKTSYVILSVGSPTTQK
jgi:hypothetical protein